MRATIWGLGLALAIAVVGAAGCGKGSRSANGDADSTQATNAGAATDAAAEPDAQPLTYAQRRGMRLFQHYCVVCHGDEGGGDGFNAFNLDPKPRNLTDAAYQRAVSDQTLEEVVAQGGRGMNKSILMPAYGKTLTAEQIEDVVAYLRTLAKPGNESPAQP